tara:strand:+ start:1640 stop:1822 length:183 start_codon:yes stop_codon:yes gene_type:complete
LTDFINCLAEISIISSRSINLLAAILSQISADKVHADCPIEHFNIIFIKAKDSQCVGLDE